jgi:hypothetical protein
MQGELNGRLVWLLLLAAGWVAQAVRKASAAAAKARAAQKSEPDPVDRTRQVQQEVARKIAERRKGAPPPALPNWKLPPAVGRPLEAASPPLRDRPPATWEEEVPSLLDFPSEVVVGLPRSRGDAASASPAPAAMASTVAASAAPKVFSAVPAAVLPRGSDLMADLRQPATVRRAILLREIIGPPVALRRSSHSSRE